MFGTAAAQQWVEGYLYRARLHRALEESVLAEGERRGFSERRLRRAARDLGIRTVAGCWELPAARAACLEERDRASSPAPLELNPAQSPEPAARLRS